MMPEDIKRAVASSDYASAMSLWNEYTVALANGILTADSVAQARELVEHVRPILGAARTDAHQRLRALPIAGTYLAG
ncbi:MAG TPA: hypothetical protein VKE70_30690 [Candidatus Solibacter sp.]|nr:hypothetical protein [Candidatus Solibacter sp.]